MPSNFNNPLFNRVAGNESVDESELFGDEVQETVPEFPTEEPEQAPEEPVEPTPSDSDNAEDGFVPDTSPEEEVVVEAATTAPAGYDAATDVVDTSNDVDNLVDRQVAVENYRGIIKHFGLTPGIGAAIRTGLESIHCKLGHHNVIPSLESIESEESGVTEAADRRLEDSSKMLNEAAIQGRFDLKEASDNQARTAKAFADESIARADILLSRLPKLDEDAVATVKVPNPTPLSVNGVFVGDDPRHQDIVEDTIHEVFEKILKPAPTLIKDAADVLRRCKDYEDLIELSKDLQKVGAELPSITGRTGQTEDRIGRDVCAIRTQSMMGESFVIQRRAVSLATGDFASVGKTFLSTFETCLITSEASGEEINVSAPPKDVLKELLGYLVKSCENIIRLTETSIIDDILEATDYSVANNELPDMECAHQLDMITDTAMSFTRLSGSITAYTIRTVSASLDYLTACVEALEQATAQIAAQEGE